METPIPQPQSPLYRPQCTGMKLETLFVIQSMLLNMTLLYSLVMVAPVLFTNLSMAWILKLIVMSLFLSAIKSITQIYCHGKDIISNYVFLVPKSGEK